NPLEVHAEGETRDIGPIRRDAGAAVGAGLERGPGQQHLLPATGHLERHGGADALGSGAGATGGRIFLGRRRGGLHAQAESDELSRNRTARPEREPVVRRGVGTAHPEAERPTPLAAPSVGDLDGVAAAVARHHLEQRRPGFVVVLVGTRVHGVFGVVEGKPPFVHRQGPVIVLEVGELGPCQRGAHGAVLAGRAGAVHALAGGARVAAAATVEDVARHVRALAVAKLLPGGTAATARHATGSCAAALVAGSAVSQIGLGIDALPRAKALALGASARTRGAAGAPGAHGAARAAIGKIRLCVHATAVTQGLPARAATNTCLAALPRRASRTARPAVGLAGLKVGATAVALG